MKKCAVLLLNIFFSSSSSCHLLRRMAWAALVHLTPGILSSLIPGVEGFFLVRVGGEGRKGLDEVRMRAEMAGDR